MATWLIILMVLLILLCCTGLVLLWFYLDIKANAKREEETAIQDRPLVDNEASEHSTPRKR